MKTQISANVLTVLAAYMAGWLQQTPEQILIMTRSEQPLSLYTKPRFYSTRPNCTKPVRKAETENNQVTKIGFNQQNILCSYYMPVKKLCVVVSNRPMIHSWVEAISLIKIDPTIENIDTAVTVQGEQISVDTQFQGFLKFPCSMVFFAQRLYCS